MQIQNITFESFPYRFVFFPKSTGRGPPDELGDDFGDGHVLGRDGELARKRHEFFLGINVPGEKGSREINLRCESKIVT